VHRLNKEERGTYLGKFAGEDKILTITSKGEYKLYTYDLLNHFDEDIVLIEKYYPQQVITLVYFDGESKSYMAKRFTPENISTKTNIITEHENSRVELVTMHPMPIIDVVFSKEKDKQPDPKVINLVEFAPMVNMKAKGKKLSPKKIKEINLREAEEAELDAEHEAQSGEQGLSPMELHRRAMEKISRKAAQDFMKGDKGGQAELDF
jgi:topoisomerase-4 subunit A